MDLSVFRNKFQNQEFKAKILKILLSSDLSAGYSKLKEFIEFKFQNFINKDKQISHILLLINQKK